MTEDEDDVCKRATEIALEIAREECGGDEAMVKVLQKMVGLEDEIKSKSDCDDILKRGLNKQQCNNFKMIRRWVMCKAWQLIEQDKVNTFDKAMNRAWKLAKDRCNEIGVEI